MSHYLIIGGSSGIGKTLASTLLESGHSVTCLCRTAPDLPGVTHHPFSVEGDSFPSLEEPLDGLAYLPGTINLKPFRQLKPEEFTTDYTVNCLGAVKVLQHFLPLLEKGSSPSIVFVSTVAVTKGMAFHSSIASAKGAVEGLTRSLAAEFAPKIRVNCVAPSLTETPLAEPLLRARETIEKRHPLQRIGRPEDIAEMIAYLLSEKASWVTGQILHVDGGLSTLSTF